jgi:predicted DNA-binding protein
MSKKISAFRLSDAAVELLKKLAENKGVSTAVYLELMIREAAAKEGLTK